MSPKSYECTWCTKSYIYKGGLTAHIRRKHPLPAVPEKKNKASKTRTLVPCVPRFVEDLYNKRRILRNKTDDKSIEELQHVEEKLAIEYSESMARKIRNELKEVNWEDGG